jgi:hypothetical protein
MRRREFIAFLLGPLAGEARAQGRVPRLAILSPTSKTGGHSGLVYVPFTAGTLHSPKPERSSGSAPTFRRSRVARRATSIEF